MVAAGMKDAHPVIAEVDRGRDRDCYCADEREHDSQIFDRFHLLHPVIPVGRGKRTRDREAAGG